MPSAEIVVVRLRASGNTSKNAFAAAAKIAGCSGTLSARSIARPFASWVGYRIRESSRAGPKDLVGLADRPDPEGPVAPGVSPDRRCPEA